MTDRHAFSVGDLAPQGDAWQFALYGAGERVVLVLTFASRKAANVSRRLMKEIIARTVSVPPAGDVQAPHVPISWGELIDKVTILEIKCERFAGEVALRNVRHELALLHGVVEPVLTTRPEIAALKSQLGALNEKLWRIEDSIREKEARAEFDAEFVGMARSVYKLNDERSALKRAINGRLDSAIVEEKSYGRR